ncbi:unnamed protein product [Sympodiomycopsis kandeliae]
MSTRRSARTRTAAEDDIPAAGTSNVTGHGNGNGGDLSPSQRKRKRDSREATSVEADQNQTGSAGVNGIANAGATSPSSSPTKKGPGRPRGRPPKNAAPPVDTTNNNIDNATINGTLSRPTRSTRNAQAAAVENGHDREAIAAKEEDADGDGVVVPQEDDPSSENDLLLDAASAASLTTILEQFAPKLLQTELPPPSIPTSGKRGKRKSINAMTLSDALNGRSLTLQRLRDSVIALRRPVISASLQDDAPTEDKERLASTTLVLSLIDEIAQTARRSQLQAGTLALPNETDIKQEADTQGLDSLLDGDDQADQGTEKASEAPRKYALHMRLPLGDFFTKAVDLPAEEARKLNTGTADLVEIEPPPYFTSTSNEYHSRRQQAPAAPTLGSRRYQRASLRVPADSIEDLRERRMGRVRPTTDLYYGPYASFAPTYDSGDSNISRDVTSLLWRTKLHPNVRAAHKAWNTVHEEDDAGRVPVGDEEWEFVDHEDAQEEPLSATKDEPALDLDPSLDPKLIASFVASTPSSAEIENRLRSNASLLDQLQDYQWTRLRSGYARWKSSQKASADLQRGQIGLRRIKTADIPEDEPSEAEHQVARQLLEGLTDLVKLRPQAGKASAVIPTDRDLHILSRSVAIDPALCNDNTVTSRTLDRGYWGTLDGSLYGPQSQPQAGVQPTLQSRSRSANRSGGGGLIVPSFESNSTARLDIKGENASHTRRINSTKAGLPPGVQSDLGGHGLLDRTIASLGRHVSHQASISAGIAPPQQPPPPPPPPSGPVAMSPPSNPAPEPVVKSSPSSAHLSTPTTKPMPPPNYSSPNSFPAPMGTRRGTVGFH